MVSHIFLNVPPYFGEDEPILTHMFQRGWFNHQKSPSMCFFCKKKCRWKFRLTYYKVGPLLVLNGVITPINGLINGFVCGYNPFKWSYGPLSVTRRDPPCMEVVVFLKDFLQILQSIRKQPWRLHQTWTQMKKWAPKSCFLVKMSGMIHPIPSYNRDYFFINHL